MEALAITFCFIVSLVLSLIIANAGAKRQIGFGWSLFWGIWLTPIVSLVAVLLSDKLQPDEYGRIEKKWGCLAPFIVSFLIVGTVTYVIYSYSNRSKQRIKSHIELQVPEVLSAEPPMQKSPKQDNRHQIDEAIAPEIIFAEPSNSTYDALTKKGTNPANEIRVDLNDFLGTPDDGIDWNSTELSENDCKTLARQKIYYSENKDAWVKERLSNNDSTMEGQRRRETAEQEIKKQAQSGNEALSTENVISRQVTNRLLPQMTKDVEGLVVLKVEINPNGEVVKCEIDNSSTINDTDILKQCTKAALRTKYNAIDSNSNQFDKITYSFKLK